MLSFKSRHISTRRSRVRRIAVWTGAVLLLLVVALGAVLSISDWNFARDTIASIAAGKLHRSVRIDGDLHAHLLSRKPRIRIEKIVIGNPEWVGERDFVNVERIEAAIDLRELLTGDLVFESLIVERPNVSLIADNEGRTNFNFADAEGRQQEEAKDEPREAPDLPAVRRFTLRGGNIYVRDELHKLMFEGTVDADESIDQSEATPFRLHGDGTLNGEAFMLKLEGGALANLQMDKPYQFSADVTAGKTVGVARGEFAKPFDFSRLTASLDIKGDNLAHLYYLTNLALPFTPPYHVSGEVQSSKRTITVHNLDGKVGKSDIRGDLTIELAKRPKLVARLKSNSLNLVDLSPAFGKGVRVDPATGDAVDSAAPGALPPDKLFPTYRFQFDRLRGMDADVILNAASVQTQKAPFKEVTIKLQLNDSVLTLDPLLFTLPQGTISAKIRVDAHKEVAQNQVDVRVSNVRLDQFKGKDKNADEAPLDGVLQARMQISGPGNSVHELAANATGKVNAVVPRGEVRKAFAELAGINVARGVGLLLTKDQSRTTVRCGVATVNIHNGDADIDQMVFDTETVLIKGDGKIDLDPELLDVDISGHPKKLRLARLRTPVKITGPIRKPGIGVDAGETAKQVGVAGVLGALLSPLAAALAFIDPGLAKDEDCAALLAEAERQQGIKVKPVSSSWLRPAAEESPAINF